MKHKNRTFILCILLAAGVVTTVTVFRVGQSQPKGRPQERADKVLEGQMTDRQKHHSKLFKHSGAKLRSIAAGQNGEVEVEEGPGLMMRTPETSAQLPVFHSAVCNADAVIVGTFNNKSSQLNADGNFIFTDYQIVVDEVFKDNALAPIKRDAVITGTRDGGSIQLEGRVFRAQRADFTPPIVGQRYLLFLRFIPATGAYLMYGNGTFELEGEKIIALGPEANNELAKDATNVSTTFMNRIRSFANAGCQPQ